MVLAKLDSYMQKNENGPLSYTIHKNKLKRIKDLNVRTVNIKFQEENIASHLFHIRYTNIFLDNVFPGKENKNKIKLLITPK